MFGLQIGDRHLNLKDVKLSFTLKSPMFTKTDGSSIFTFDIPASDPNKEMCGFPGRVESVGMQTNNIEVTVIKEYMPIWYGVMKVVLASPLAKTISCSIGLGKGEFYYLVKDKTIKDTTPDEQIGPLGTHGSQFPHYHYIHGFDSVVNKFYPKINYAVFPVNWKNAASSLGDSFSKAYDGNEFIITQHWNYEIVNPWKIFEQVFVPDIIGPDYIVANNNNGLSYTYRLSLFCPFPYNSHVLKHVFHDNGFILQENPFDTDPELMRLVIFNNQLINFREMTQNTLGNQYRLSPNFYFNLKDHVPSIAVQEYLSSLEDMFFCRTFVNNSSRTASIKFLKDIINDPSAIPLKNVIGKKEINTDHDTIGKLIQTADGGDGLSGLFKKDLEGYNIQSSVATLGILPPPAFGQMQLDSRLVLDMGMYYVCKANEGADAGISKWNQYCFDYFNEQNISNGNLSIESKAIGIPSRYSLNPLGFGSVYNYHAWRIPYVDIPAKIWEAPETFKNECSLRFMFYRGMVDGRVYKQDGYGGVVIPPITGKYPFGSCDVYDLDGNKLPDANYSTKWEGPYGTIEKFGKDYLNWINNFAKPVVLPIEADDLFLKDIDFSRKYEYDGMKYFIDEVRGEMIDSKVILCELACYTAPN